MSIFFKFLIFFFAIMNFANNCTAQSKEETEKWITEKINKYMPKRISWRLIYPNITSGKYDNPLSYDVSVHPRNFKIDSGNLVFDYSYLKIRRFPRSGDNRDTLYYSTTLKAPIYSLSSIYKQAFKEEIVVEGEYNYLEISLNCRCGKRDFNRFSDIQEGNINYFPLFIFADAEENLESRMINAFRNLTSFYPKKKEIF